MPIHNAGYRTWEGRLVPGSTRWLVIASTGIRRTWQSRWLRRLMFFAFTPVLFMAIPLFLFEQAFRDPQVWRSAVGFIQGLPNPEAVASVLAVDPVRATPEQLQEVRHNIWAYLLLTMFRYPQALLMVLVIGIVAPPLISHDVRSRAFLIYFSRPITRLEYVCGKMGTVVFFLVLMTTVPALLLYASAVMLSTSTGILAVTWDLPLRVLVASIVLALPTTSLALMFSSVTTESRYAGFAWFAIWILGQVTYNTIMLFAVSSAGQMVNPGWRILFSMYHTLGIVQAWVFGLSSNDAPVVPAMVFLVSITVVSLAILYRRVSSPMRA